MTASAHAPDLGRGLRLLTLCLVAPLLLTSCSLMARARGETTAAQRPVADTWRGRGLVLAACGDGGGLGAATIELWEVDPASGTQTGHRAVAVPRGVSLAYPCSEPGVVARRLFNHDFTAAAVQVDDEDTDATRAGVLDLTTGEVRVLSRPQPSAFAALPHDGFAVFDEDGRTLWYLAGNERRLVSYDPDLPEDDAWEDHAEVGPSAEGFVVIGDTADGGSRIYLQRDTGSWYQAQTLGLPDPTGQLVAVGNELYDLDEQRGMRMFCTSLFAPGSGDGDGCMDAESTTGSVPDVRPAAWVDDDTLLAFDGPRTGRAANSVVRLEFDADHTAVVASPTMPSSDWLHQSAVVSLDCGQFATLAVRGDQVALFVQDLSADDGAAPRAVAAAGTAASEAPAGPSPAARLLDWVQPADATVCAS